jgi:predicted O-methyltransferase YrrM
MPWWHAVAERDHEILNPTSREKLVLLGHFLGLTPDSSVLDIAAGKGGPAVILSREFGSRITCVERAPEFVPELRERVRREGLEERIEIVAQDATEFPLEPERYDVGMCIGATFVWRNLDGTLAALTPTVRPGGHLAIGEVFLHKPVPGGLTDYEEFASLSETAARFDQANLELVTLIASSLDDWDRYESLHWRAVGDWLAANPEDPDADDFRLRIETRRAEYLEWGRDTLGWGIFVARKR